MTNRIYVAGHRGMVGAAIMGALARRGEHQIITRTHSDLDLTDSTAVRDFFAQVRPTHVYIAAAKVGGIHANNTYPAEFIHNNLMIQSNVIHEAWRTGVKRLLFLGSSCIYPRDAAQPMREEALLTGTLEPTNEPYAIAKIAGIKMCESYNRQYGTDFRCVMPTNLFGPGDNYHPENSHVVPALIRRFHEAKISGAEVVTIWGTGTPRREFMYVDDMAEACVHLMSIDKAVIEAQMTPVCSHINIGTGVDMTIRELAEMLGRIIGFSGRVEFDPEKPDGMPVKRLDVTRLHTLGWMERMSLEKGLRQTYKDYLERYAGR